MQASSAPEAPPPSAPFQPPVVSSGKRGGSNLATILAAVAIVLAMVALAMNFIVPGPSGSAGTNGGSTVTLWGVIDQNGSVVRSSGVLNASNVSEGVYNVYFAQFMVGCTFTAGVGRPGYSGQGAGSATVTPLPSNISGVRVVTYNATQKADWATPFHLIATCPAGLSAVVAANGKFISGAGVNNTSWEGVGAYQVLFTQNVAGCAYYAGLGNPGHGSAPSGYATTASRISNPYGVWIRTSLSNGTSANETFFLNVYC